MKIQQMQQIKASRENLMAFLHITEIKAINKNLADDVDVNHMNFDAICDTVLEQYQDKKINNKQASNIFEILADANENLKTEKFRADGAGAIFMFSEEHNAYLFYCKGGKKELNKLIKENGRFV
ncbi:hypothetical protein C0159_05510 [Moraxella catarrhalis]|uniref:Uncharacterized protein n=1 Tax=Moraxella catarrhalis TaxID=480 RepID=A0A3Q9GE28_MORCA|nr:hypothetical protein [Moraxella catarrhalis]AZQ93423.1 hypothetical protein EJK53_1539 [Moraxella catarrhalis]AZQ93660.1 hypothetical protein EJK53_1590 [Moraxella catarrhalis]MPX16077.1 hypothetical protein [Moraxella catarrhalis]MPX25883.1 hypothetical protein [Moraxella catarrhalis]MPX71975.1 hypothetical protein [Moraxella catarrhalis]